MARYWFARRFALDVKGANAVAPVSREGWMVVTFFGGCLIAGAAGLATFALGYRAPFIGLLVLVGFSAVGIATFLVAAVRKSDQQHTVDDYRHGRVGKR